MKFDHFCEHRGRGTTVALCDRNYRKTIRMGF